MRRVLAFLILAPILSPALGLDCPADQGLYPDPQDCKKFYQCSDWVAYRFECGDGLVFNPVGYCDWPANVNCGAEVTSTGKPTTTTERPTTTTTSIPTTTTSRPTTTTKPTTTSRPTTTTKPTTTTEPTTTSKPTTTAKPTTTIKPATTTEPTTTSKTSTTTKPTTSLIPSTTTSGVEANSCNVITEEPITDEIRTLRMKTCLAPNSVVESVLPGSPSNPENVRILESIFSQTQFKITFPEANSAYTYENLLKAFAKFPEVCKTAEVCRKTLAMMFAHFQQETAGLFYIKEINQGLYCADWSDWVQAAYPCSQGQKYFGRGAKQLTWNYNYGALSTALYGDPQILLDNPDLVSDTWLNFASAIWFYLNPQPPKPSMLAITDQTWKPNKHDLNQNRKPGFGSSIMVINGAYECGMNPINANGSRNRQLYYRRFAADLSVDISQEKLDCQDMLPFDAEGSANPGLYWAPESGCNLATWQTAYSALVEGDYKRCLKAASAIP